MSSLAIDTRGSSVVKPFVDHGRQGDMAATFMESGTLRECIREWVLLSFPEESTAKKTAAISRALQLGDTGKYRLVDAGWVPGILATDPRSDPNLYSANQYDCEDLAFAARVAVAHRLMTQPPPDGYLLPPAFGFLATELHVLNIGVGPDERPYLYDVRTKRILVAPRIDGSFLDGTVTSGWLDSVERIRYAFI